MTAPGGSPAILVVVVGRIARAEIRALCERARRLVEASGADLLTCDVGAVAEPDLATVNALARLQLVARRAGCSLRLRDARADLQGLLVLTGLSETVGLVPALSVGCARQAEQREQACRVEEEVEPGDPAV